MFAAPAGPDRFGASHHSPIPLSGTENQTRGSAICLSGADPIKSDDLGDCAADPTQTIKRYHISFQRRSASQYYLLASSMNEKIMDTTKGRSRSRSLPKTKADTTEIIGKRGIARYCLCAHRLTIPLLSASPLHPPSFPLHLHIHCSSADGKRNKPLLSSELTARFFLPPSPRSTCFCFITIERLRRFVFSSSFEPHFLFFPRIYTYTHNHVY